MFSQGALQSSVATPWWTSRPTLLLISSWFRLVGWNKTDVNFYILISTMFVNENIIFGQSNEVGGSYHMEKESLKRSLALDARGVTLDCIIADHHFYVFVCLLFVVSHRTSWQHSPSTSECGWVHKTDWWIHACVVREAREGNVWLYLESFILNYVLVFITTNIQWNLSEGLYYNVYHLSINM